MNTKMKAKNEQQTTDINEWKRYSMYTAKILTKNYTPVWMKDISTKIPLKQPLNEWTSTLWMNKTPKKRKQEMTQKTENVRITKKGKRMHHGPVSPGTPAQMVVYLRLLVMHITLQRLNKKKLLKDKFSIEEKTAALKRLSKKKNKIKNSVNSLLGNRIMS